MDIDAALDDIERVVVDGDMRPEAREKAGEQLEALTVEFARLMTQVARLRNDYAVFEELAPPDMPRKDFANRCFDAWNMLAPGAELEVARLRTALLDITGYYLHDAITQASDAALIAVYEIARRAVTPLDTAA